VRGEIAYRDVFSILQREPVRFDGIGRRGLDWNDFTELGRVPTTPDIERRYEEQAKERPA
jgi:hypothetical protein